MSERGIAIRLNAITQLRCSDQTEDTRAADSCQLESDENTYDRLWQETARGLQYCHQRVNANTSKTLENASFLYALVEILIEKGVLTVEELDARKKVIAKRLVENFKKSGLGIVYQDPEMNKYDFDKEADVDCKNHTQACKAVCCKFPFALSRQDIGEGKIKWDFARPYMIAHDQDGYCTHLDRKTFECTVREHRPVPCRGFDCRNNKRWQVWLDFDRQITSSALFEALKNTEDKN